LLSREPTFGCVLQGRLLPEPLPFIAQIDRAATLTRMASRDAMKRSLRSRKAAAGQSQPLLLAGGNPQIAKADGDVAVQTYIAAMPGWKRDVGRRLDAIIVQAVPNVRKSVKWNSPFYGIGERGWFLSFHCFTHYVKVAFFRGASLRPLPPGKSKQKEVRYLDVREDDAIDEVQFAAWVKQASRLTLDGT